jgi:hypothetical protein
MIIFCMLVTVHEHMYISSSTLILQQQSYKYLAKFLYFS